MKDSIIKILLLLSMLLVSCSNKGALKSSDPLVIRDTTLSDYVIARDAIFSGEIVISGSLIVKKSANLTILPGTVIKFSRFYKDDDDISDSELTVEGSIRAIGTADKPITFTSNEPDKMPKDWKFIMVNLARESVFDFCIVEYAYSGVQVHFTKATVKNSVFRNNYDGVRFSTAKIRILNNEITDNVNGIRYEERGARATISRNNIHGNKIGIFAVIRSDDLSYIQFNNIRDNSDYNVKLGIKQAGGITLTNNYWGTDDEEKIRAGVFDKAFDDLLGEVTFIPYLKEKPPFTKNP